MRARYRGCLLGLACGDAVGTSVEFKPRGTFSPIEGMVGGGPFHLKPGEWTDDTSMALCLAVSLLERGGFDAWDQMDRYCRWQEEGYLSSNGVCFDIGNTVAGALNRYRRSGNPYAGATDPYTAGNGSIMRLAPIPMFYSSDLKRVIHFAAESSRTTHGAREAVDACRLFSLLIALALGGETREHLLSSGHENLPAAGPLAPSIAAISRGEYRDKSVAEIKGSGYVVESLEAALWCFYQTDNYRDAILLAVNLGDDADTTAGVCGQLAGAHHGLEGIPETWLEKLAMREEIQEIADQLFDGRR